MKTSLTPKDRGYYSMNLRNQLKANYVKVPPLSPKLTLLDYYKHALTIYKNAIEAHKKNNIQGSYVEFHKLSILLLERLPQHKDYNSNVKHVQKIREWIVAARVKAIQFLDDIVVKLDEEEYRILMYTECKSDLDLIDEFDGDDQTAVPSIEPSAPVEAAVIAESSSKDTSKFSSLYNDCDKASFVPIADTAFSFASLPATVLTVANSTTVVASAPIADSFIPDVEYPPECDISAYEEHSLAGVSGVNSTDVEILCSIEDYRRFPIPMPISKVVNISIGGVAHAFSQDDFHVSFGGFLAHLPPELQMSRSAVESNRCFFLHLGIATSIHPFVLQTAFRYYASTALSTPDVWYSDIVSTVNEYAGFVDANALSFLWPQEFDSFVVCLVSGPLNNPILSCFAPAGRRQDDLDNLTEVFIRCDGSHFTLLKPFSHGQPVGGFKMLSYILQMSQGSSAVVHFNEVQPSSNRSVRTAIYNLRNQ